MMTTRGLRLRQPAHSRFGGAFWVRRVRVRLRLPRAGGGLLFLPSIRLACETYILGLLPTQLLSDSRISPSISESMRG